jgi:drug/metabolite transporter (DMT)-like permease
MRVSRESDSPVLPRRVKLTAAFAGIYLIWGSTYLAVRIAIDTLPPLLMSAAWSLLPGTLLYTVARLRGDPKPAPQQWRAAFISGVLLISGGVGAFVWAEQTVPSGITSLVLATIPLWMVLLDWLWGRGPRPGLPIIAGLIIGSGGVAGLVGPDMFTDHGIVRAPDLIILLASAVSWSVGSIYARRAALPQSLLLTVGMQMLAGGAVLLVAAAVAGEFDGLCLRATSMSSLLALVYLVAIDSVLGYSAYVWLLGQTSAARVSTYAFVNPVVAVFLGWRLGGEHVDMRTLVAAGAILAGVALITLRSKN